MHVSCLRESITHWQMCWLPTFYLTYTFFSSTFLTLCTLIFYPTNAFFSSTFLTLMYIYFLFPSTCMSIINPGFNMESHTCTIYHNNQLRSITETLNKCKKAECIGQEREIHPNRTSEMSLQCFHVIHKIERSPEHFGWLSHGAAILNKHYSAFLTHTHTLYFTNSVQLLIAASTLKQLQSSYNQYNHSFFKIYTM